MNVLFQQLGAGLMNIAKLFILFFFSFSTSLYAEEAINMPPDAVKGALPECTDDLSLIWEAQRSW